MKVITALFVTNYEIDNKFIFCFKTDPNDPNGPDLDTKMDELKHAIRRAEVRLI